MNTPPQPPHVVVHHHTRDQGSYGALCFASWTLLFLTIGFAFLPFLGMATWLFAIPIFTATFIMSIIVLARGGTAHGFLLLVTSILFGPVIIFFAPFIIPSAVTMYYALSTAKITESESSTKPNNDSIAGRWQRDEGAIITFHENGTFDIDGHQRPAGHYKYFSNYLQLSNANKTSIEAIVSTAESEMVTKSEDGSRHTYKKVN